MIVLTALLSGALAASLGVNVLLGRALVWYL